MRTAIRIMVSAMSLIIALESRGQSLTITSFHWNGEVSWTNSIEGVLEYRVQASDAILPCAWTNDMLGILPTGSTMSLTVPMLFTNRFYRLAAVTNYCDVSYDFLIVDLSAGPAASSYPVSFMTGLPAGGWTDEYKTTNMVFRRIPEGTFTMGSPGGELGRNSGETQHQVTLTQPFYVCVFEVTQKQWERVMGTWPSYFNNAGCRDTRPVEQVSYDDIRGSGAGAGWPTTNDVDAGSFMGRLRVRTGMAFDLPTEAQWEYAGRAGETAALNTGHDLTNTASDANMSAVGRYWYNGGAGWTPDGNTSVGTAAVGSYLPNQWGLYDIHGNVREWCLDWYGTYPDTVIDPAGAAAGGLVRADRGGSWDCYAHDCRIANRDYYYPAGAEYYLGFRAVLPLP